MKTPARRKSQQWGLKAESLCAAFLMLKFYRILARRFKTPVGEVDIIAMRGRSLVFVEVKARRDAGALAEAVSPQNRQRVTRAAQYFLSRNPRFQEYDMRFDVMLVGGGFWPAHKKNAWQLDELPASM